MELKHKRNIYTPQHNGIVEWMNGTLMERVRTILSRASLEDKLWVEVVCITCYVIKRSPLSPLMDNTPIEDWMGKKPSLQHLHVLVVRHMLMCPKKRV